MADIIRTDTDWILTIAVGFELVASCGSTLCVQVRHMQSDNVKATYQHAHHTNASGEEKIVVAIWP